MNRLFLVLLLSLTTGCGQVALGVYLADQSGGSSRGSGGVGGPNAPTTLVGIADGVTVDLTWLDSSNDETSFEIERRVQGAGAFSPLVAKSADATAHSDSGLQAATTYEYRVRAVGPTGASAWSGVATATTDRGFLVFSTGSSQLHRVLVPSFTGTLLDTITGGSDIVSVVRVSPTRLFFFARQQNSLIDYDLATQTVTAVVNLDQDIQLERRGFDLSPGGVLYGVLPGMQLRLVDPVSGTTTFVATITGAARVENLAFAPDGTLYASGSSGNDTSSEQLYTLDPGTGVLTSVGPYGVADVDYLSYAEDGFLYGVDAQGGVAADLYRINPTTGAAQIVGNTGVVEANGVLSEAGTGYPLAATPAPASGLTATTISSTQINLSWSDNSGNETGFRIERRAVPTISGGIVPQRYAGTGNHYAFIPTPVVTPQNARTAAAALSYLGVTGHVATITSAAENTFVSSLSSANGWIAGTDSGVEGTWVMDVGPEAGTTFWFGGPGGTLGATGYAGWDPNEPNDATAAGEDWVHLDPRSGLWNDLFDTAATPYFVEFETSAVADPAFTALTAVAAGATSHSDTTASPSTVYEYRVIATNGFGDAAPSNVATATTP